MAFKSLILVTGASRGIGREIVHQSIKQIGADSIFILTARKLESLVVVEKEIIEKNPEAKIYLIPCELAKWNDESKTEFCEIFDKILDENQNGFDKLYLFHNAGSIGDVSKKSSSLSDVGNWSEYLHANFLSMVALNNLVLEKFEEKYFKNRIIINITSLLAIKPFPSTTQYSCGKAIREAFFRSLADENPELRILSYSPGPVETDMHDEVANLSYDAGMRATFKRNDLDELSEIHRRKLSPNETVERMWKVLNENSFTSGQRVDYFDFE